MATAKTLVWRNENETQTFAKGLARRLTALQEAGDASLFLVGDLGAGKSTFARFLLQALGVTGRIKSPTYAIVESYQADAASQNFPIWHFDFYRFQDPEEWESAGFRDIFASPGLKLVEWPQKAAGFLPKADVLMRIGIVDENQEPDDETQTAQRRVELEAQTSVGEELLA